MVYGFVTGFMIRTIFTYDRPLFGIINDVFYDKGGQTTRGIVFLCFSQNKIIVFILNLTVYKNYRVQDMTCTTHLYH